MKNNDITIEEIPLGSPRLKQFVKFAWQLYRNDPCWTPPLNADYLGNRLLGFKGLLTPNHAYHHHAEVTHFLHEVEETQRALEINDFEAVGYIRRNHITMMLARMAALRDA